VSTKKEILSKRFSIAIFLEMSAGFLLPYTLVEVGEGCRLVTQKEEVVDGFGREKKIFGQVIWKEAIERWRENMYERGGNPKKS